MLAVVNCAQLVTLAGPNRARVGEEMQDLSVIWSDNDVVHGGAGTVTGVSRGCEECIVDTFTGRLY